MSDVRRIVTLDAAGTATPVLDLEDGATFQSVRDSWTLTAPTRKQTLAEDQRRYGGARVAAETHDNGSVSWNALVSGGSADAAFATLEAALSVLEQARNDLFFEWRADGSTSSIFYEVRGPATYSPDYKSVQFAGAKSFNLSVTVPLGPLGRKAPVTQAIAVAASQFAFYMQIPQPIGGRAPAPADVEIPLAIITSDPAVNPRQVAFAMVAWAKRPTAPAAGYLAPFGVVQAAVAPVTRTAGNFGTVALVADASVPGGQVVRLPNSAASKDSVAFTIPVDPRTMQPDDFTETIDLEVFCRLRVGVGQPGPTVRLGARTNALNSPLTYSREFGAAGRLVTKLATTGTGYRVTRLGTLTMSVKDPAREITVEIVNPLNGGNVDIDHFVIVPARSRAASPTGRPVAPTSLGGIDNPAGGLSTTFPHVVLGGGNRTGYTLTLKSDLRATLASTTEPGANYPSPGLGGARILLPPGLVDMLVYLVTIGVDDPTPTDFAGAGSLNVSPIKVTATPRQWIASG